MKTLKTMYPCRHCGVPAKVRRTSEADHACCPLCATIGSIAGVATWSSELAMKNYRKLNGSTHDGFVLATKLAPVIGQLAEAGAAGLTVAILTRNPRGRADWVRWSHKTLKASERLSAQLRELTADQAIAFELISGGRLDPAPEDGAK
jgi:hypothetical protein